MIKYKDTILENYFIDPVTAIITNDKGEIQKTYIKGGRPYFKCYKVHEWQVHTHIGYQKGMVIHHIDKNKMNNALSNLVYLTHSEHAKLHNKGENSYMFGKHLSEETKKKISESISGEKHPLYGKHLSEETKRKMSKAAKGKNKDRIWITNGVISKRVQCNDDIPEGFSRGRLKK